MYISYLSGIDFLVYFQSYISIINSVFPHLGPQIITAHFYAPLNNRKF